MSIKNRYRWVPIIVLAGLCAAFGPAPWGFLIWLAVIFYWSANA